MTRYPLALLLILALGLFLTPLAAAAQPATRTIPMVMAGSIGRHWVEADRGRLGGESVR